MPFQIIAKPASWEDVLADVPNMDTEAVNAMINSKIVDDPDQIFTRWSFGHDVYVQFNGKTGVTLKAQDEKYKWVWDLTGASVGDEFVILNIPADVFANITRTFSFHFIKFEDLFPEIDEIRFYSRNVWGWSIYIMEIKEANKRFLRIPKLVFSKTTQNIKISVVPNQHGVDKGELEMWLVGRIAVPTGADGEPNPKAMKEMIV